MIKTAVRKFAAWLRLRLILRSLRFRARESKRAAQLLEVFDLILEADKALRKHQEQCFTSPSRGKCETCEALFIQFSGTLRRYTEVEIANPIE